jgi:DNA-binding MarR family transcriptional regulator
VVRIAANRCLGYQRRMAFDLNQSATYLSSLIARGFARSFQSRAASLGFSPGQFPILVALWNEDGLTQRALVDRLDIEQATMANTLTRMERDGLIERRPHPTDKRAQMLFLTPAAKAMQQEAEAAARAAEDAMFGGFRRFERELVLEYMRWLVENAHRLEAAPDEMPGPISDRKQIPV